ncbi:MAG: DEAD/DEAH box helicase [Saprospiraceae bacterium]|nr:DEAD/DEAH box helicase [Saprospiraceae bacterium]
MSTFDELNLNNPLRNALQDLGLSTPTPIQEKAFSVIMSGRDIVGIAQTGTGKTFAYLLPLLRLWKYSKDRFPKILVVVPTRELVVQVAEAVEQLTTYMNVEVVGVYGGTNINTQIKLVEQGLDVLVATPGRLLDLIYKGALKPKKIKKLVIDEVDEMLNLGFRHQLLNLFDLLPDKRQNLLFSATLTEEVEDLLDTFFNFPKRIEAAPVGTPLDNISQTAYHVPNFNTKVNLLQRLLEENEDMNKVLVFSATKKLSDVLFERLAEKYPERVGVIHSNKAQNNRFNSVKSFKDGTYRSLIATDLIARGLDIAEVSHVINFDIPEEPESYIHRIGRTGRADAEGVAISFITEKDGGSIEAIQALMNYEIPVQELPEDLEISDELIEAEKPQIFMKNLAINLPDIEKSGGAFHEKTEKNKKVNKKVRYADKMKLKYKKPKTRGQKQKKRKK